MIEHTMQPPRWAIQEAMDELGDTGTLAEVIDLATAKAAEEATRAAKVKPAQHWGEKCWAGS